ncbi:MAG: hypothetical protein K2N93_01695, partial [Alistipes sp.]|nr:hypothetical protein [Alistipes sp.]
MGLLGLPGRTFYERTMKSKPLDLCGSQLLATKTRRAAALPPSLAVQPLKVAVNEIPAANDIPAGSAARASKSRTFRFQAAASESCCQRHSYKDAARASKSRTSRSRAAACEGGALSVKS